MSLEWALPIGALAFYVYDASQLLLGNELLLTWHARDPSFSAGAHWQMFRRHLFVPNLLAPQAPLFRMYWVAGDSRPAASDERIISVASALGAIQATVLVLLMMLLGFPIIVWGFGLGMVTLSYMAAFYVLVVAALLILFRRRSRLGLTLKEFWHLAFDVLACVPFSVNLVRKLSLLHPIGGNPFPLADRLLKASAMARFSEAMIVRIDAQIHAADIDSLEGQQLVSLRMSLVDGKQ